MFTWNLQYVSKKRLADTMSQLSVNTERGNDLLVRIHTAIHTADEAVDLAAYIKKLLPEAQILGTSTSAVISGGKLIHDQCVISITQMADGCVHAGRIRVMGNDTDSLPAETLLASLRNTLIRDNTKLLLTFFTDEYRDIERFTDISNELMPGIQMLGGVVDWNDIIGGPSFVFDENGWSSHDAIFAALSGEKLDSFTGFATGIQIVGDLYEITKADGNFILEVDGKPAAEFIHEGIGKEIARQPDIGFYFPLAYSLNGIDVPFITGNFGKDGLGANHNITVGRKIRRAFFYDRKIVSDNRSLFGKVESFEKGETIFAYACKDRFRIYPNSFIWELSAYENSNICGCSTQGEISAVNGRNVFTNCVLVLGVAGENPATQQYNPYVFLHTETLAEDNRKLLGYLMDVSRMPDPDTDSAMNESLKNFVKSCEEKLLYSEKAKIANEAALYKDMTLGGYDRICMIDVPDVTSMRTVFSKQLIDKTFNHYISECTCFATRKNYRVYMLNGWQMAIAVPSFTVSLADFTEDMRILQKKLFEETEDYIAIISVFCVINDCKADTFMTQYNMARVEMVQKNIQFYVCDGGEEELDEDSIRERYHMVNVINYALSHDKVIPYYQGIYDNKAHRIQHFEALMRLMDENGRIYTPIEFLDCARSYGLLYDALSMAMLKKVFEAFQDSETASVSINLGFRDIKNEELTAYIYSFLSTARHPEMFIFEILENEDVDEYETLIRFVNTIHKLGGLISIDDFGSGYSNLVHVINIPSDYLKIDGSIVKQCCKNRDSENLIALISAWNRMNTHGSKIIAEFVENEGIQDKLIHYNIEFSQGYLFSKPSPDLKDT